MHVKMFLSTCAKRKYFNNENVNYSIVCLCLRSTKIFVDQTCNGIRSHVDMSILPRTKRSERASTVEKST